MSLKDDFIKILDKEFEKKTVTKESIAELLIQAVPKVEVYFLSTLRFKWAATKWFNHQDLDEYIAEKINERIIGE